MKEKTGKPYIIIATAGAGDFANSARGYYSWLYDQNGSIFPNGYEKADFKTPELLAALGAYEKLAKADLRHQGAGRRRRDRCVPQRQRRHLPHRHLAHR